MSDRSSSRTSPFSSQQSFKEPAAELREVGVTASWRRNPAGHSGHRPSRTRRVHLGRRGRPGAARRRVCCPSPARCGLASPHHHPWRCTRELPPLAIAPPSQSIARCSSGAEGVCNLTIPLPEIARPVIGGTSYRMPLGVVYRSSHRAGSKRLRNDVSACSHPDSGCEHSLLRG
jgi:hypothetical protein